MSKNNFVRKISFILTANGTDTRAIRQADGTYKLYGYKWFSSATDSDMTLALARIVDENGQTTKVSLMSTCFVNT